MKNTGNLQTYTQAWEKEKEDTSVSRIKVNHIHDKREKSISATAEQNLIYTSFISLVFLPYIIGMLLSLLLFSFYLNIPVMDFFHVYSGFSQLLFWVFGMYLMITVVDIWLIMKKVFGKK